MFQEDRRASVRALRRERFGACEVARSQGNWRKVGEEMGPDRPAGLRSYGQRQEFGFYSRYKGIPGKLPKGFKERVTESGFHGKKVTLTVSSESRGLQ